MNQRYFKTQEELSEVLGIPRPTIAAHIKAAGMRKSSRGWDSQKLLDYLKEKESETTPIHDAKEMKVRLECDILRERLKAIREETIPMEDHLAEITEHAQILIQGLDELENITAAEFPDNPRMLEIMQGVVDKVRLYMFAKVEALECAEEE